jgi:hypothetical protein
MIDLLVFVTKDAPLQRIDQIVLEARALGLEVTAVSHGLGVITGRAASTGVIAPLRRIKDVARVTEPTRRSPPPTA